VYPQDCIATAAPDWALSRICKRDLDIDGSYDYPPTAGEGVDVYVIDSGIYTEHEDFENRAIFGYTIDPNWGKDDDNGHGTYVASLIGGKNYGVAKKATLIAVQVLIGGHGTISGLISGIEWVASNLPTQKKTFTSCDGYWISS